MMDSLEMNNPEAQSTPLLTEDERRVLDVYDRLEELQLEIALLKAQGVLSQDKPTEASDEEIANAEQELLQAKAAYQIRSNIVDSVLVANPILKAVHGGENASVLEQDLLPLVQQRDDDSVFLARLSSEMLKAQASLKTVSSENIIKARENTEFTTTMIALAGKASSREKENIDDPEVRFRLDELEVETKTAKQRWRIMKGTTSATIVGSGLDWARDEKLIKIVLDGDSLE